MATVFCFTQPECKNTDCERHHIHEVDCRDMDCFSDKMMSKFCKLYCSSDEQYNSDEYQRLKAAVESGQEPQFVGSNQEA